MRRLLVLTPPRSPQLRSTRGKRGDNVDTYEPGETITVKWVEYVPHPG